MGHKGKKNASELVRASDLHEILQPLAAVRLVEAGSDAAGVQRHPPAHGTGEAVAARQELERRVGHHEADGGTGSRHLAFADKDLEPRASTRLGVLLCTATMLDRTEFQSQKRAHKEPNNPKRQFQRYLSLP